MYIISIETTYFFIRKGPFKNDILIYFLISPPPPRIIHMYHPHPHPQSGYHTFAWSEILDLYTSTSTYWLVNSKIYFDWHLTGGVLHVWKWIFWYRACLLLFEITTICDWPRNIWLFLLRCTLKLFFSNLHTHISYNFFSKHLPNIDLEKKKQAQRRPQKSPATVNRHFSAVTIFSRFSRFASSPRKYHDRDLEHNRNIPVVRALQPRKYQSAIWEKSPNREKKVTAEKWRSTVCIC